MKVISGEKVHEQSGLCTCREAGSYAQMNHASWEVREPLAAPYVSARKLVSNSMAAMLAAIEMYNKPQLMYRDEIVVILIVNSWELALKAELRRQRRSIFYPKKRGQEYRSISLVDALKRISASKLWPAGMDGASLTANIQVLNTFRDRSIHLYNAPGIAAVVYPFLQQNVLNYRDFILASFKRDLADSITWQLLPLGANAPAADIKFMKVSTQSSVAAAANGFIEDLRSIVREVETGGHDMSRVATQYDIHLNSVKSLTGADLQVSVSPGSDGRVVIKKSDPNQTHPYSATKLLESINSKRSGRTLTSFDLQAVIWKQGLRADNRYAWKHGTNGSHVWSGEALNFFAKLTDAKIDSMRTEYTRHLRPKKTNGA